MQFPVHLHGSVSPLSPVKVFDLMLVEVWEPGHLHSLPSLERIHIYPDDSVCLPAPLMFVVGTIMTIFALTSCGMAHQMRIL